MYNSVSKIESFARACFEYAMKISFPVYLSTKYLLLKEYDGTFKRAFDTIYEQEYKAKFEKQGIWYEHKGPPDRNIRISPQSDPHPLRTKLTEK
eukprot:234755-Amphidinium_carterae.1